MSNIAVKYPPQCAATTSRGAQCKNKVAWFIQKPHPFCPRDLCPMHLSMDTDRRIDDIHYRIGSTLIPEKKEDLVAAVLAGDDLSELEAELRDLMFWHKIAYCLHEYPDKVTQEFKCKFWDRFGGPDV